MLLFGFTKIPENFRKEFQKSVPLSILETERPLM
jgi:hypothetical protein